MKEVPLLRAAIDELRHRGVELDAAEAIAVVLAVGDALGWRTGPPPLAGLMLRSDGLVDVDGVTDDESATAEAYARLLDQLLPEPGSGRGGVPGGVRLLIARATNQTDLPPVVVPQQFATLLRRFAPPSVPESIVAVMLRWAEAAADAGGPPLRRDDDRRGTGPTTSQLRNFLLEGDLERYAMRQRLARERRKVPAPAVAALSDAPVALASFSTVSETPRRTRRGRRVLVFAVLLLGAAAVGTWLGGGKPDVPALMTAARTWLEEYRATPPADPANEGPPTTSAARASGDAADNPAESAVGSSGSNDDPAPPRAPATSPARADAAPGEPMGAASLEPLRTTSSPAYSPSFGLDSRSIYFHAETSGGSRLLRAATNGEGGVIALATLLDNGAQNYHVRPSPDGRMLAFDSDRDGERGVYLSDAEGRDVRRVSGPGYAVVPSWSPDGQQLAFARGEPGRPRVWNLWLLDLTSGEERKLTQYTSGQVWPGTWFSDGRRLAFTHETTLFVLDTASGGLRGYESPIPGRLMRTPAVAPDDRHIAFQVYRDGMWIVDTFTHRMRRVLSDSSAEEFTWSRDGHRLAFHSRRSGRWGVWLMRAPIDPAP